MERAHVQPSSLNLAVKHLEDDKTPT
jgi:hypothetical protein